MKKNLLFVLLLLSFTEVPQPAEATPAAATAVAKSPNQLNKTRRRLRRQAAQRMRRNKRMHPA